MPTVNGKEYPYTEAGKAAAAAARENSGPAWGKGMLSEITSEYPALARHPWELVEGDPSRNMGGGYLEFYPPDEIYNPVPGKPTIEVYPSTAKLPREEVQNMVFGDMLHYLPEVDPSWREMRGEYQGSLTDRQRGIDRMAYQRDVRNSMDHGIRPRSFDRFMDTNRLDAHVRGYLAPDKRNEWAGMYNPEQIDILNRMRGILGEK